MRVRSITKQQILTYVAVIGSEFTKFTELQQSMGISDVALLNNIKELIEAQYLIKEGTRHSARYKLTQKGCEAIRDYLIEIDYYLDAVKQTLFGDPCKAWKQLTDFGDYEMYLKKREVTGAVIYFCGGLKLPESGNAKISDFVLQSLKEILEDERKKGIVKLIEIAILKYDCERSMKVTDEDLAFLYHLLDSIYEIPLFRAVVLKIRNMKRRDLKKLLKMHSEQNFD